MAERIQGKLGKAESSGPPPSVSSAAQPSRAKVQQAPVQQVATKPAVSQEELERLKQVLMQQQKELEALRATSAKDRDTIQKLEETLLTNFELMEHSVSDSLGNMDEKLNKIEQQRSQVRTRQREEQTSPSVATNKAKQRNLAPKASPKSVVRPKPNLIEDVSLMGRKKKQTALPASATKDLVPLPLPPENEIVDETRPLAQRRETQVLPLPVKDKGSDDFYDPGLDEPKSPYTLTSRPQVKSLYDQGLKALINYRYKDAIETFEGMLKQFPDDDYSDNAQFWLGRAYYSVNQLDQAEQSFYRVLANYEHRPTSQGYKTPDAMFMLGKISIARNSPKRSQYYFNEVIKRFPSSTAASNAEEELKVLNTEP